MSYPEFTEEEFNSLKKIEEDHGKNWEELKKGKGISIYKDKTSNIFTTKTTSK
jgi:hypothetical protein